MSKEGQTVKSRSRYVVKGIMLVMILTLIPCKLFETRAAVTRLQKPLGGVWQMWAGLTHHVQPERLAQISQTIPKVLILTGDEDHLVHTSNSAYLKKHMPEAEYIVWKDTGHIVSGQHVERFNTLLERTFVEGRAKLEGRS